MKYHIEVTTSKNRVRGGKLGRICSRIRKTQSLLHPAFLLSDAGNPPSVCLGQRENSPIWKVKQKRRKNNQQSTDHIQHYIYAVEVKEQCHGGRTQEVRARTPILWDARRRKEYLQMEIGAILRELCRWKGVEIIEAEVCPDHIHMLVSIPPKMSVSGFMG